MQLHAATKILLWVMLVIIIQLLQAVSLTALSALLLLLAALTRARDLPVLIRRTRWLLLSLLSIYGFATPGEANFPGLGALSPTAEGLHAGAMQAWRLMLLLAGLSVLSATTSREDLLNGIYLLLRPFKRIGADPERIALRLWLTLHYAEQVSRLGMSGGWRILPAGVERLATAASEVTLGMATFRWLDLAALMVELVLGGLLLL